LELPKERVVREKYFGFFGEDSKDLAASLEGDKGWIVLWCTRA